MKEVSQEWGQEGSGERKWKAFKTGMSKAAEMVLGRSKRRQPDWFLDNKQALEVLITKRNNMFARWLKTCCPHDRQRYVMQRRAVAREIRRCKNAWFQEKAHEVELAVRRGRGAWKGLREIQRGRAGLRPVRPRAVKDLEGKLCAGHDSTLQRWHQHFSAVLNVPSRYDVQVVDAAEQHPEQTDLGDPPSEEEVMEAIVKLRGGRAGGKNGILPEMVKGCGGEMMDYILDLFHTVWRALLSC